MNKAGIQADLSAFQAGVSALLDEVERVEADVTAVFRIDELENRVKVLEEKPLPADIEYWEDLIKHHKEPALRLALWILDNIEGGDNAD